jgi:hypothetical protein
MNRELYYRAEDMALAAAWLPASQRLYISGGYGPITEHDVASVPIVRWSVHQRECTVRGWYRLTGVHKRPSFARQIRKLRADTAAAARAGRYLRGRWRAHVARCAAKPWLGEVRLEQSADLRRKCYQRKQDAERAYLSAMVRHARAAEREQQYHAECDLRWAAKLPKEKPCQSVENAKSPSTST